MELQCSKLGIERGAEGSNFWSNQLYIGPVIVKVATVKNGLFPFTS